MKSTIDLENMLYNHLKPGSLVSEITGDLWKGERPVNVNKEDVVINVLPINNLQLQTTVANVNIHVPNLLITTNGTQEQMSNTVRLNQLFNLAQSELKDQVINDTAFDIQQQNLFKEDNSSYINVRIEIYNINISN